MDLLQILKIVIHIKDLNRSPGVFLCLLHCAVSALRNGNGEEKGRNILLNTPDVKQ